jgi:hypothetical protein
MEAFTIAIGRADVLNEVGRLTAYIGSKMQDDDAAYDRIRTTGGDDEMLALYWDETADLLTEQLKPFLYAQDGQAAISNTGTIGTDSNIPGYFASIKPSSSYDTSLTPSVQTALRSYFIASIVARWCKLTNKAETEAYTLESTNHLTDAMRKLYYKRKPTRVTPT